MLSAVRWVLVALATVSVQQHVQDPSTYGPDPELVHLYHDQWPTGLLNGPVVDLYLL